MHAIAFHHITDQPVSPFDVTPEWLDGFVSAVLDSGGSIVPPSHALSLLDGEPPDDDAVALIFDDGYVSTMTHALPLMRRHRVCFGMAPVPGTMQSDERPSRIPHSSLEFVEPQDLERWRAAGGELLGHSYSHADLTTLATSTLRHDLDNELAAYERFGLEPPTMFAHPFGAHDERVRQAVAERYLLAFATGDGHRAAERHRFELHRITYRHRKSGRLLRGEWAGLEEASDD